jgi:hypothetical protein
MDASRLGPLGLYGVANLCHLLMMEYRTIYLEFDEIKAYLGPRHNEGWLEWEFISE